jgi:DNA-binding transcriptional ArsR family regulator
MMTDADFLASAAAVADPTRLRMLFQLGSRPSSVGQLAVSVGVTSSAVTYHVALMSRAGLVVTERHGRRTLVRRIERRWAAIVQALAAAE